MKSATAEKIDIQPTLTEQIAEKAKRLQLLNQRAADATATQQNFQQQLDAKRILKEESFYMSVENPTEKNKTLYGEAKMEVNRLLIEYEESKDVARNLPSRIKQVTDEKRTLNAAKEVALREKARQMYTKKSAQALIKAQQGIVDAVALQTVLTDKRTLTVDGLVALVQKMYKGEEFRQQLVDALGKLVDGIHGDQI